MAYAQLKSDIAAVIRNNGNQEITGNVLQGALLEMINALGANYQYAGVADTSTTITTTEANVFYLLTEAGTYANMSSSIVHQSGIGIALWNGTAWSYQNVPSAAVVETDATPMANSTKPVQSGGVYEKFLYSTQNPNLFNINNFTVDKGDDVVYTTDTENGTISVSNATSTRERFRINLSANDTSKTYNLTFKFQRNKTTNTVLLYTSTSSYQTVDLDENGYGSVEGFTGSAILQLGIDTKDTYGTVVFSEITLVEDIEAEEYIKISLLRNIGFDNLSQEVSGAINSAVKFTTQSLTNEQKAVARNNIGAMQSILTQTQPFDYGVKDFYSGSSMSDGSTNYTIVKNEGELTITHTASEASNKTLIINLNDTPTRPGETYRIIFSVLNDTTPILLSSIYAYNDNTLLETGTITNGQANFTAEGAVNRIGLRIKSTAIGSCSVECVINNVEDVPRDIVDTDYLGDIDEDNLSQSLRDAINYGAENKKIELSISATSVTQEGGRYCHCVGSGGVRLVGNGTKTITLAHTDSVGNASIMTLGLFAPWNTQNIASIEVSCDGVTHTIAQADEDFRTKMGYAYHAQGDTYNRVSFYASDSDITITVTSTSENDWEIEVSDSIVIDDTYGKTPILIEYDGGDWNGAITDDNDTFNQWEMHRRLHIPYGINISNIGDDAGLNEYATLSIGESLAELSLRYANTPYGSKSELELVSDIIETYSELPVATKGVVGLGASVYDKNLLRCLSKAGVKIVRNNASNAGGITMKGYDNELIVCDSHFMNVKTTIPLYGLPVILWCHGVGNVSDDDPNKRYYSNGANVLSLLKWLKQKEEEGIVELLSPSEFVERLK